MSLTAEQIAERLTGMGGSDAAAACGLSKWKTRFQLWQEKLGLRTVNETEPMRWGSRLEPVIRQAYCDRTGRTVVTPGELLRHESIPELIANVDGIADGHVVAEFKTARTAEGWGEEYSGDIPQEYLLQVQHYMLVTGLELAEVAVLIGGSDFRIYAVEADLELQGMLIDEELAFWELVKTQTPPEPETPEDIRARWPQSIGKSVTVDPDVWVAVSKLASLKADIAKLEDDAEYLAGVIQKYMAEHDTLLDPRGNILATWRTAKPTQRFDVAGFKDAHPEQYAKFLKTGASSRRFLLKGQKE